MDSIPPATGTASETVGGASFDLMRCEDPNVWFHNEREWAEQEQQSVQRLPWTDHRRAFIALEQDSQQQMGVQGHNGAISRINDQFNTLSDECIRELVHSIQVFLKLSETVKESRVKMDYLHETCIKIDRFVSFEQYSERMDYDLDSRPRYRDFHRESKRYGKLLQLYVTATQNLRAFQTLRYPEVCSEEAKKHVEIQQNDAVDQLTQLNEDSETRDVLVKTHDTQEKLWLKRRKESGRLGPGWVRIDEVNTGGFSHVDVWAKQDSKGYIIDSVAVKEIDCSNEDGRSSKAYTQKDAWVIDERVAGGRVPMEVQVMYDLRQTKSDCIVKIRGWHVCSKLNRQRILMEYCPHDDLDTIKNRHDDHGEMVPEPFIWWTYENLAQAGIDLEHCGHGNGQSGRTLIHSDLKPANVYGGVPSDTEFRGYPRPKLGDFGLSFYEDHTRNQWGRGTRGHRAPEQTGHLFEPEFAPKQLTTKTNVWGVGMIVWCLMHRRDGDSFPEFSASYQAPEFDEEVENYYSYELMALVSRCLEYLPESRPDFDSILAEIRRLTDPRSPADLCMGLRNLPAEDKRWEEHGIALQYLPDDCRIGMPLEKVMGHYYRIPRIPQHPRPISDQARGALEEDVVYPRGGEAVING